jgi:hypothetical protein
LHHTLAGREPPTYLTVEVSNLGIMPALVPLSFFRWKKPFNRGVWVVNPLDFSATDEWVPQRTYPIEVPPRAAKTFWLQTIGQFREQIVASGSIGATRWERARHPFLSAIAITDDGRMFPVKLDKTVRQELRTLAATQRRSSAAPR